MRLTLSVLDGQLSDLVTSTQTNNTMNQNKALEQRLLDTLDRWERAYTGYALMAVTPERRKEICVQSEGSDENVGNLINETRKLLSLYNTNQ